MKLDRLPLGTQFGLLLVVLMVFVGIAGSIIGRSVVESQVLNEARSIADMTEHIGKWASQYGGTYVRTTAESKVVVGSFLDRREYPGAEAYHWKNPALIQREVSDIAASSRAKVQFRLTAQTVLNPRNTPDQFEREAIKAIANDYAENPIHRTPSPNGTADSFRLPEYWSVKGQELRYARAIITAESCLRCHASRDRTPEFLRTNAEFNGGGGFGYEAGKPNGVISVRIPVPRAQEALAASLTMGGWLALGAILAVSLLILFFVARRVIRPINRLRAYAEALTNTAVDRNFEVPEFAGAQRESSNEVHRLAGTIGELGQSVKILFEKLRKSRQ